MGLWVRGQGSGPYPLADGLGDHLIGVAIEVAAETDSTITTFAQAWSEAPSPFSMRAGETRP